MLDFHAFLNRQGFVPLVITAIGMFLLLLMQSFYFGNWVGWWSQGLLAFGWYMGGYARWIIEGKPQA